jgi:hypothetical protein
VLAGADDATLVAAIGRWARVEAAASARRLAAIAELVARRVEGGSPECGRWSCDNWDAMAAEVGSAQGISQGLASGQMYLSVALRDRLPRIAALFAEGTISYWLARTIVWHTDLIKDPETLQLVRSCGFWDGCFSGLTWGFAGLVGVCFGYAAMVRGMVVSMRSKARRCSGVGSVSLSISMLVPW